MRREEPDHDPRDRMADYLAGRMDDAERAEWERRVLEDPELSEALYGDLNLRAGLEASRRLGAAEQPGDDAQPVGASPAERQPPPGSARHDEHGHEHEYWRGHGRGQADASNGRGARVPRGRAVRRPRRRSLAAFVLPLAAVFLAVLIVPRLLRNDTGTEPPVFRGVEGGIRLLQPAGATSLPPHRFLWTRDPAAERYRFELYDAELRAILRTVTADTFITLPELPPEAIAADGDAPLFWRVVPLGASGTERPAPPPERFHPGEAPRR